jgi:hypothetical protein
MCGGLACRCTVAYGVPIHPSIHHQAITRCAWHDFGTSESEAGQRRARTQAPCTRTHPIPAAVAEDRSPEVLRLLLLASEAISWTLNL